MKCDGRNMEIYKGAMNICQYFEYLEYMLNRFKNIDEIKRKCLDLKSINKDNIKSIRFN